MNGEDLLAHYKKSARKASKPIKKKTAEDLNRDNIDIVEHLDEVLDGQYKQFLMNEQEIAKKSVQGGSISYFGTGITINYNAEECCYNDLNKNIGHLSRSLEDQVAHNIKWRASNGNIRSVFKMNKGHLSNVCERARRENDYFIEVFFKTLKSLFKEVNTDEYARKARLVNLLCEVYKENPVYQDSRLDIS